MVKFIEDTWLAVEKDGTEKCSNVKPEWSEDYNYWSCSEEGCDGNYWPADVTLPEGTIKKILGRKLTWEESPILLNKEYEI